MSCGSAAAQWGTGEQAILLRQITFLWPQNSAGRDRIHADCRCQFLGQRAGKASQPRLGRAVERETRFRALSVDVCEVDDGATRLVQPRQCCLTQQEGCSQVDVEDIGPICRTRLRDRGGAKDRGVVNQAVQAPPVRCGGSYQRGNGRRIAQVGA